MRCFSVLCQMHSLTVWELLNKSVPNKDTLVYSQLTLCVSRAGVNRLFAGPGAVWQLQHGPPCSPICPAEREVCLGLTFQSQDGSSITAALSGLPCILCFPRTPSVAQTPCVGSRGAQDRIQQLAVHFLCATAKLLQRQETEIYHCCKEALQKYW